MFFRLVRVRARLLGFTLMAFAAMPIRIPAQESSAKEGVLTLPIRTHSAFFAQTNLFKETSTEALASAVSRYVDPAQGLSSDEIIQRALGTNAELAAARLDIERARARVRQAGLRPNPTIDFEQTTGKLTGSEGERDTSIGFALPLELNGQRQKRVNLAEAELEAAEAHVADRERRLVADVRTAYADALAAARELEITEALNNLDIQTVRIVEARVNEGESAPLELKLLQSEADRLKSRSALVEGRLQAAILRLKSLFGVSPETPFRLRENLTAPALYEPPASLEAALDIALRTRPDLRLARLSQKVAEAGFELARAQGRPDVTAFTKYSSTRSTFDDTPLGVLRDKDNVLSFGVSVSIPLFNRNQGAKAEAATAIAQAQHRREFAEQLVRAEVASAYARYEAARSALAIYERGVLARSAQNLQAVRGAYELGAFRMTELLAEQRRLTDLQREYTDALTERYKALADLMSAIGVPSNPGAK